MKNNLCPQCDNLGRDINYTTVDSLVEKEIEGKKYSVCLTENCEVVYFNNLAIYETTDLRVQVWFKEDSTEDSPICYCSKLTRKEIKQAVAKGYNTVEEIREYTTKKLTGHCLTENPLGECCHQALQEEIAKQQ
ncbi:NAD(P)H-nitrite reductase [Halobacteroides halobius DSM 5150]|uniref:NAD(P)H-nitrite reductase n=1 Tax=Halobacteroides halobius (strain ATCC 35273 / DSM 5150 / MD-1) TaxID=748449 RepID=L0K8P6_HALHC|nr:(2Fe-2S)-binding protein [Halobacteroides halobius]AGB40910.1 NAD(P)H-nitrite reductase [Halobacteroides halobius DSM 5150]